MIERFSKKKIALEKYLSWFLAQFGPSSFGPQHGFARISRWTLERAPERLHNGDIEALFSLMDSEFTRSMWNFPWVHFSNTEKRLEIFSFTNISDGFSPHRFRITYRLILREKELHFHIGVFNPSKDVTFSFNLLLHTYLKVPDVRRCQITGLHGCTFIDKVRNAEVFPNFCTFSLKAEFTCLKFVFY